MKTIAFDTETHLIKPGCLTPRLVCVTTYDGTGEPAIYDRKDGLRRVREMLEQGDTIIGHHVFFDLAVVCVEDETLVPLVFQRIDEGKIHCTKIRDMIIANTEGYLKFIENELGELKPAKFSLADLVRRRLALHMGGKKGADVWRLRYNELDGIPIDEWPEDARTYAMDDAGYTFLVYKDQEREVGGELPGEVGQTQAAWALYLMGVWGIRTDPDYVAAFEHDIVTSYREQEKTCIAAGFVRSDGSKNMQAIKDAIVVWCIENKRPVPMTNSSMRHPGGQVKTDRETLKMVEGGALASVAELVRLGKLKTTYLPILKCGTEVPINASYNPIIETYRTSCRSPNLQNPIRTGGFRECFVPHDGWVYVFCDYSTIEMRTLAQVCLFLFGYSVMADALRAGNDLHLMVGADILGISYEEASERLAQGDDEVAFARQLAKPANFGFPGGMGASAFVSYAKGYGITVTIAQAEKLHKSFRTMWPEMGDYFDYCASLMNRTGDEAAYVEFVGSMMVRGKVRYTAVCNGFFQHLAAMGAKAALYAVAKECYLGTKPDGSPSPLAGSRPVFFLHDEIGMEVPRDQLGSEAASAAADRLAEVMIVQMEKWVPDVPVLAEASMVRRWHKGAKPVRENGVLLPCKPLKKDGKTVWVYDDSARGDA